MYNPPPPGVHAHTQMDKISKNYTILPSTRPTAWCKCTIHIVSVRPRSLQSHLGYMMRYCNQMRKEERKEEQRAGERKGGIKVGREGGWGSEGEDGMTHTPNALPFLPEAVSVDFLQRPSWHPAARS